MHIAFATYVDLPELFVDDILLKEYFESRGHQISVVIWDDPSVNWALYDTILIRSIWDYFLKPDQFKTWMESLSEQNIKVYNPVSILKWNSHKRYLLEIQNKGILLPEQEYILKGSTFDVENICKKHTWNKAVIKPTISAGAYKTWIITPDTVPEKWNEIMELSKEQDIIIQKFSNEIMNHGELSLLFFNKKYSHAVIKRPREGDFRVQHQYGGIAEKYIPPDYIIREANEILHQIPETLLYARIDGFVDAKDGRFRLMELELLEPVLFFRTDMHAVENFYDAFIKYV